MKKENSDLPSPHALLAVPRSLIESKVWGRLQKGAQLFYLHLLMFSNTRTFKPVWPAQSLLHARTRMTPWTQRLYTAFLVEAGILIVHAPGKWQDPETGRSVPSKVYEFPITEYINQDICAANKKAVSKGMPPRYHEKKDIHRLERTVLKLMRARRVQEKDLRAIKDRLSLAESYLDFSARLIKIVGVENGAIHIELHTNSKPLAQYVEENLPKNVLLFPKKYTQDVIINKYRSWSEFVDEVARVSRSAANRAESDILSRLIAHISGLTPEAVEKITNAG